MTMETGTTNMMQVKSSVNVPENVPLRMGVTIIEGCLHE